MTDPVCGGDCARCFVVAAEQPHGQEWSMADGVFIKEMLIPKAGTLVPQHAHRWDHTTYVAHGAVRVWLNGVPKEVRAPAPLFIKAGVKHLFESLEDDTLALCIHNVARTGSVEVAEEHHLTFEVA